MNPGHIFTGPHLTTIATNQGGNTSEFSIPWIIGEQVYLPFIRR
jgi:hypothetical protein